VFNNKYIIANFSVISVKLKSVYYVRVSLCVGEWGRWQR